jgi:hypothetical protein
MRGRSPLWVAMGLAALGCFFIPSSDPCATARSKQCWDVPSAMASRFDRDWEMCRSASLERGRVEGTAVVEGTMRSCLEERGYAFKAGRGVGVRTGYSGEFEHPTKGKDELASDETECRALSSPTVSGPELYVANFDDCMRARGWTLPKGR